MVLENPHPPRERIEWTDLRFHEADDPAPPRVLLIGDSIVVGYTGAVVRELEGRAHVDRLANSRCVGDPMLLREVRHVLAAYAYAVIHFNNGLHGWEVSEEEYAAYLAAYADELRALAGGARLLWAASTPSTVPGDPATFQPEKNPRVLRRNEIAAGIMDERRIPRHDLYAVVAGRPELSRGDGAHYNDEGNDVLGRAVAARIGEMLD